MAPDPTAEVETAPSPDTVEAIYEHVRGAPREFTRTGDALDQKSMWALGAGSVVLGLTAVLATSGSHKVVAIPVVAAIAAYAFLAFHALRQLWTRSYAHTDVPKRIWADGWNLSASEVKQWLIVMSGTACDQNAEVNRAKAASLRRVLIGLALESGAVAAAVVVRVLA